MERIDIYRIAEPVGTSWEDVEWLTVAIVFGTYKEAFTEACNWNEHSIIQFHNGHTWEDV